MASTALETANFNQRRRAQELHESMFSEKSQMDLERLSLDQQRLMLEQSKAIEAATFARAKLGLQLRRNISAAAAIERMGILDPADPKFLQKLTGITSQYPDALGSTFFQKVFEARREDHKLVQDATSARITATFNDPDVSAAYTASLQATNDPKFANAAAVAAKETKDKAKALAISPDLTPEERASIYNPADGKFNLDPTTLTKLELQVGTVKAQREAAATAGKPVKGIVDALKALEGIEPDEAKDPTGFAAIKAARFNLQSQLKDKSFASADLSAPPTTQAQSPDKILAEIHSLGLAPGETPPPVVTPAVTPSQSAAIPAPAPAASDNADPEDLLNEAAPVEE